jgi:hypothetical protein
MVDIIAIIPNVAMWGMSNAAAVFFCSSERVLRRFVSADLMALVPSSRAASRFSCR